MTGIDGGVISKAAMATMNGLSSLQRNLSPVISFKRIPRDILEHVKPYASRDYVLQLIGKPNRSEQSMDSFSFKDASLQIKYTHDHSIETVAIVLLSNFSFWLFPIDVSPLGYKLGRMTMADVWNEETHLARDFSSKFWSLSADKYFGNPGNYWGWKFGVFRGSYTTASQFPYDHSFDKLLCAPSSVKLNWIEVSLHENENSILDFHRIR